MATLESGNEKHFIAQQRALNMLVIEKSDADYFLLMDEIHKANFSVNPVRITSIDKLNQILFQQPWDLIISNNTP